MLNKMKETEGNNLHVNNIISEFEVSNNEAIKMYDDNIEYTNLNIVNNNRFVISKANSVLIDLNLNKYLKLYRPNIKLSIFGTIFFFWKK